MEEKQRGSRREKLEGEGEGEQCRTARINSECVSQQVWEGVEMHAHTPLRTTAHTSTLAARPPRLWTWPWALRHRRRQPLRGRKTRGPRRRPRVPADTHNTTPPALQLQRTRKRERKRARQRENCFAGRRSEEELSGTSTVNRKRER